MSEPAFVTLVRPGREPEEWVLFADSQPIPAAVVECGRVFLLHDDGNYYEINAGHAFMRRAEWKGQK